MQDGGAKNVQFYRVFGTVWQVLSVSQTCLVAIEIVSQGNLPSQAFRQNAPIMTFAASGEINRRRDQHHQFEAHRLYQTFEHSKERTQFLPTVRSGLSLWFDC